MVLEVSDTDGQRNMRDHCLASIKLLGQNPLGIAKHLLATAASVLRGHLLPQGQAFVLPVRPDAPFKEELQVTMALM